jgi:hypothetical protein
MERLTEAILVRSVGRQLGSPTEARALARFLLLQVRDLPYELRRVGFDNLPVDPGPNEFGVAWKAVIDRILQP